jgi:hypothetical protein
MSQILSLPLSHLTIVTVNNQDWIESIKFVVQQDSLPIELCPQLDLRGMWFEMEIRRAIPNREVVLTASRDNGRLLIGAYPNYGFLLLLVPVDAMMIINPGAYVGDIVAHDGEFTRTIFEIDLTVDQGTTR